MKLLILHTFCRNS